MNALLIARNYLRDKRLKSQSPFQLDTQIEHANHIPTRAHIAIHYQQNCVGKIGIEKAVGSALQKTMGMTNKQLHNCIILHTPVFTSDQHGSLLLPMLAYFALRQARIWHCQNVIVMAGDKPLEQQLAQLLKLESIS